MASRQVATTLTEASPPHIPMTQTSGSSDQFVSVLLVIPNIHSPTHQYAYLWTPHFHHKVTILCATSLNTLLPTVTSRLSRDIPSMTLVPVKPLACCHSVHCQMYRHYPHCTRTPLTHVSTVDLSKFYQQTQPIWVIDKNTQPTGTTTIPKSTLSTLIERQHAYILRLPPTNNHLPYQHCQASTTLRQVY